MKFTLTNMMFTLITCSNVCNKKNYSSTFILLNKREREKDRSERKKKKDKKKQKFSVYIHLLSKIKKKFYLNH